MIKHKIISITVSIALLLGNLARAQAANEPVPEQLHQIEALQRRAENLAFGALGTDNYHLAKARAWLDMALLEYHQMDTSGLLTAAMAQAQTLLDALENKQPEICMDTPLQISGSESVRPDLQKQIATLKKHANFSCGQRALGSAEVYLVWAGHHYYEAGQSHADPYISHVENLVHDAQAAIKNCSETNVDVQDSTLERITLSGDALFGFNRTTLNRSARASLDKLTASIKALSHLDEIILVGHTDHLRRDGRNELNQRLSERRAESIKLHLIAKGIPEDKIQASGAGSSTPLVKCEGEVGRTKQIVCLQPNRRVEIILRGVK